MNAENPSEVARLRAAIATEYEAAARGLSGLASGTARHEIINARMERMGMLTVELVEIVGGQAASQILAEALEGCGSVELRC